MVQWNEKTEDAAMVFYIHREAPGDLKWSSAGSPVAQQECARTLASRGEDFWPPVYSGHGVQVGAFMLQFSFTAPKQQQPDILLTEKPNNVKIIPLHHDVIARRLEK